MLGRDDGADAVEDPGVQRSARMTTSGYIAIRWYQHSVHGSKWATSEKYRLPAVARNATIQPMARAFGAIASATASKASAAASLTTASSRSTTIPMTMANATSARIP